MNEFTLGDGAVLVIILAGLYLGYYKIYKKRWPWE